MAYYRRRKLEWWEELAAVAAGAAVGAAAGYLARHWLRREPTGGRRPRRRGPGESGGADRGAPRELGGERGAGTAGSDPRR